MVTIFKIKYSNGTEEVYGNNSNNNANNNQDALGLGLEEGEKSAFLYDPQKYRHHQNPHS